MDHSVEAGARADRNDDAGDCVANVATPYMDIRDPSGLLGTDRIQRQGRRHANRGTVLRGRDDDFASNTPAPTSCLSGRIRLPVNDITCYELPILHH